MFLFYIKIGCLIEHYFLSRNKTFLTFNQSIKVSLLKTKIFDTKYEKGYGSLFPKLYESLF
jgi:hypothetical protein